VEEDGAFTSLLGDSGEAPSSDSARLATQLLAGVTVWRRRLDSLIGALYDGGCGKLEPTVHNVLRVALYELLLLDTPPHAAVNEAVAAVRALRRPRAAALVNAVLRSAVRCREAGTLPEPPLPDQGAPLEACVSALGVALSMPDWIVLRWVQRYGREEALALLAASNRAQPAHGLRPCDPATSLEQLAGACVADGVQAAPSALLPAHLLRVEGTLAPLRAHLRAGRLALQDEAAALVVQLLEPRPGMSLADVCAAPGGKALFAASRGASVTALDAHPGRMRMLVAAAAAQGLSGRLSCSVGDVREWCAAPGRAASFSAVLVDAPCTGLGVLAKRADLRWRRVEPDVARAAELQLSLLSAAASLAQPGGLLVYSTCSTEPEENSGVVKAFLDSQLGRAEWQLERADAVEGIPREALSPDGRFLAPMPHRTHTDGAFGARLRRRAPVAASRTKQFE